jgi:hypothetical protein
MRGIACRILLLDETDSRRSEFQWLQRAVPETDKKLVARRSGLRIQAVVLLVKMNDLAAGLGRLVVAAGDPDLPAIGTGIAVGIGAHGETGGSRDSCPWY